MDTTEFLRKILPETGLYIVARLVGKGWKHQVCESIEEAAQYVLAFDASGVPTYHACAAYRDHFVAGVKDGKPIKQVRVHKNVRALRAFWMDLDVDPSNEHKFESQSVALDGLVAFCTAASLPMPMVLSSGNGLHIYWTLTHEIIPEQWKQLAESLKSLAAKLGFKADPACTSDPARILRTIGTWNRKNITAPRAVELVADAPSVDFSEFSQLVLRAVHAQGLTPAEVVTSRESPTERLNEQFSIKKDFPPCSAEKVATRCAQVAKIKSTRGDVPEPFWYAGIQLLCNSVEGDPLIHEWSKGYAGYSEQETNQKIAQIRGQQIGPTLCSSFESHNPGGCDNCPFKGKISSPAQLGAQVTSAPAPVHTVQVAEQTITIALPNPPEPFTRKEGGGIFVEEEGILHKIYEYDCYPIELAWDEHFGYETVRIRHWLPQEGWCECTVQASLLARPVDFETKLRDNSIQPLIRNRMTMYMDSYLRKIRTEIKMRKLFRSMGWKNENSEFVLGDKLYRQNGEIVEAGFSMASRGFLEHFRTKGDIKEWTTLTSVFETPGFEPHAFMLLLAFAAPLLKLAGRQGFTVSALGETGAGKSTMGKFIASVYGHPDQTWIMRGSTANARVERIGAYYSIPAYMDEITTLTPKEVRDLVYTIATGKARESLHRDRTPRPGAEWATILVASTNDSMQSKLQVEKQNPEAESMRLFELRLPRVAAFEGVAGLIHQTLADNYGVAGAEYIQQLVAHQDEIRPQLEPAVRAALRDFGMEEKERFWAQAAALTLYGGKLAKQWGLIEFDPERIRLWLQAEIRTMQREVADNLIGPVAVLGEYLNAHIGERLVITQLNADMGATNARPSRELSQRYEKDSHTLYVSRQHIKRYLESNHHDYTQIRDDLYGRGVLLNPSAKKVLGAGTDYTGGQTACWKIKADHPELVEVLHDE